MNALEVSHLSFSYEEGQKTLTDISFVVPSGSYVALLGHNGSGKSTLAKILVGLIGGYAGEVKLFDTPLSSKSLKTLRGRLGIVFQNPDNQFVGSTVADDIAFGLENTGVPHEKMQGLIDRYAGEVDMSEYLGKEPENLSGGQKQRVALAGVLAMQPDLLIMDEATSMLDPLGKKEIGNLIEKMRKENPKLTIISITHDVEEAAKSDEVLVLSSGRLELQGKPDVVFSQTEKLTSLSLYPPFYYRLRSALHNEGVAIPDDVTDLKSLEAYLCQK